MGRDQKLTQAYGESALFLIILLLTGIINDEGQEFKSFAEVCE